MSQGCQQPANLQLQIQLPDGVAELVTGCSWTAVEAGLNDFAGAWGLVPVGPLSSRYFTCRDSKGRPCCLNHGSFENIVQDAEKSRSDILTVKLEPPKQAETVLLNGVPRKLEVMRRLGSGSYGEVSAAYFDKVACAWKRPQPSESQYTEAMEREIQVLSQLKHPNIVQIFHRVEFQGMPSFLMELGRRSLRSTIKTIGQRPWYMSRQVYHTPRRFWDSKADDCLWDADPLCLLKGGLMHLFKWWPMEMQMESSCCTTWAELFHCLMYLHVREIGHGDIKPDNIVEAADGHLKFCDFGSAGIIGEWLASYTRGYEPHHVRSLPIHTPHHDLYGLLKTIVEVDGYELAADVFHDGPARWFWRGIKGTDILKMACSTHFPPSVLQFASKKLWSNKQFVEAAVLSYSEALQFASNELRVSLQTFAKGVALEEMRRVLKDVRRNPSALQFASTKLRGHKKIVMEALRGHAHFVNTCFLDTPPVPLVMLGETLPPLPPSPLQFVSTKLKDDKAVVLAAVGGDSSALQFASAKLKGDKDVVMEALRGHAHFVNTFYRDTLFLEGTLPPSPLQFVSTKLKDDKAVVLAAVGGDSSALQFASAKLKGDKDVVMEALRRHAHFVNTCFLDTPAPVPLVMLGETLPPLPPSPLQFVSTKLKGDKDVVMVALRGHAHFVNTFLLRLLDVSLWPSPLQFVSKELRADKDIVELMAWPHLSHREMKKTSWRRQPFVGSCGQRRGGKQRAVKAFRRFPP